MFFSCKLAVINNGQDGWTPLNCAASSGLVEVLKLLIQAGANINLANKVSGIARSK